MKNKEEINPAEARFYLFELSKWFVALILIALGILILGKVAIGTFLILLALFIFKL